MLLISGSAFAATARVGSISLGTVAVSSGNDPVTLMTAYDSATYDFDVAPGEDSWAFYENLEGGDEDTVFDDVTLLGYFEDPALENGIQYFPASMGELREKNVQATFVKVSEEKTIPFDIECADNGYVNFYLDHVKIDDLSGAGRQQAYITLHEGWNNIAIMCKGVVKPYGTQLRMYQAYRLSDVVDEMKAAMVSGTSGTSSGSTSGSGGTGPVVMASHATYATGPTGPTINHIPDQVTNEDTAFGWHFLDLWDYIEDPDHYNYQIAVKVLDQTNPSLIECSIELGRWVSCSKPAKDQFGESEVTLVIWDPDDYADINSFKIIVNPVNDSPVIDDWYGFGGIFLPVGRTYRMYLPVTDVDSDTLTFSDDTDMFEIDADSGLITFRPEAADIGDHHVTFTVMDDQGAVDTHSVKYTIGDTANKWEWYGRFKHDRDELAYDAFNGENTLHWMWYLGLVNNPSPDWAGNMWLPLVNKGEHYDQAGYRTYVFVSEPKTIEFKFFPYDFGQVFINGEEEAMANRFTTNVSADLHSGWNCIIITVIDEERKGGVAAVLGGTPIIDQVEMMSAKITDTSPTMRNLPNQFTNEDENTLSVNFLDLHDYASDSETAASLLHFEIADQTNAGLINCYISDDHYLACNDPAANENGSSNVTVRVTDREDLNTEQTFTVVVHPVPDAPELEAIGNQSAVAGTLFNLGVNATDNDIGWPNDILQYTDDSPLFSIDALSGMISFTPQAADVGDHNVTITVTDFYGLTDQETFTLTITVPGTNLPPVLDAIGAQTAYVDQEFVLDVNANDPNSDPLTFSDDTALFDIDSSTGEIRFTPQAADIGSHDVNIVVSDGDLIDSELVTFNIMDNADNNAPVLDLIPDQNVYVGQAFLYDVNAIDDDGDPLNFSDDTAMFDINPNTGVISFTPLAADAGEHDVLITVDDGRGGSDDQTVHFSILENNPPVLDHIDDQYLTAGTPYNYIVTATDADAGDTLTFSDDSALFDINADTGEIDFTPLQADAGVHPVRITVTDNWGASDFQDAVLYIIDGNGNQAPYLIPIGAQTATVGTEFTLDVNAVDPDATDVLTFSDDTALFDIDSSTGMIIFTAQEADVGDHDVLITVSDGNLQDTELVTFTIQDLGNQAPSAPVMTSPTDPYTTSPRVMFRWTASNDPNGDDLTYHIQVGNQDFSTIYFENEGLEKLSKSYNLDYGRSYGRVRAFDGELYSAFSNTRGINVIDEGSGGGGGGGGGGGFIFTGGSDNDDEPGLTIDEEPGPTYTATEANEALDEAREALEELQETIEDLQKAGIDVDQEALDLADQAEAEVSEAENAFLTNDFDSVIEHAGLALELIDEAMDLLPEFVAEFSSGVGFERTAKTVALTVDGETVYRTFISLYIENNTNEVQTSIGVFETIPKDIVEFAAEIESSTEFRVIEPDPQLLFLVANLAPNQVREITYSFEGTITQAQLDSMPEPIIVVGLMETAICNHVVCDDGNPDTVDFCQFGVCVHEVPETGTGVTAPLFPAGFLALTPEQMMPVMLGIIIVLLLAIGFFEREKIEEEWKKLQKHFQDKPAKKAENAKKKGK